eukprot:12955231-Ditylum_brightwellii.AAC.1
MRWIPFFEIKVASLRDLLKSHHLDHIFTPDPKKQFYLKTDFSAKGLGFALCQPDNKKESMDAMIQEIDGGDCKFD